VHAVDPEGLVRARLRTDRDTLTLLDDPGVEAARHTGPVYVAGVGKGAIPMLQAVADILGAEMHGDAIAPTGGTVAGALTVHQGGHPLPTAASVAATTVIWEAVARSVPQTLILILLSGGASALLARPVAGLTIADKARATEQLLACGATITEVNAVRKHLSAVKGGGLARRAAGRPVWSLVLSDVVGDDLATIGSGPTVPDPSTFDDAMAVVARYGLGPHLPACVVDHLRCGVGGHRSETPKPGDPCFARVRNVIIGNNRLALGAAASCAEALGFRPVVYDQPITGDTTAAARQFAGELSRRYRVVREPTCVVAGGETTVVVRGRGRGGRNQEFALAAALALDGMDIELLSAGTDGIDGPTDAAGAFASGGTLRQARTCGLDARAALAENDSYRFFEALGALFRPGATATNVMDLKIALLRPPAVC
jgi:hydroxypyruvate reductase